VRFISSNGPPPTPKVSKGLFVNVNVVAFTTKAIIISPAKDLLLFILVAGGVAPGVGAVAPLVAAAPLVAVVTLAGVAVAAVVLATVGKICLNQSIIYLDYE
jgi:hypothetical protein